MVVIVEEMEVKTPMSQDYDAFSSSQLAGSLQNVGKVTEALLLFKQEAVIHIADFGSATGLNSMKTFTPALQRFREVSSAEVVVHHVDIPINHWQTLFDNYWNSEFSYRQVPGVYVEAAGGSLYKRMFPSNSLSVVYSSAALHWLSELVPVTAETVLEELNSATKELSRSDLHTFLSHRYAELRPGGRLIARATITNFYKDLMAHFLHLPYFQALPKQFFLSLNTRVRYRTIADYEEVLAAFTDKYRVVELRDEVKEHPVFAMLRQEGNREQFAEKMVAEMMAVATSTLETVTKGLEINTAEIFENFKLEAKQYFLATEDQGIYHDAVLVLEKIA